MVDLLASWNKFDAFRASWFQVDLLARSWVEIYKWPHHLPHLLPSTSSRGRELKSSSLNNQCGYDCRPPCEVVSWNIRRRKNMSVRRDVDLFARSWVEIICKMRPSIDMLSRPPCEVVSWNYGRSWRIWNWHKVDLLVRSWVEIIADLLVSDNS